MSPYTREQLRAREAAIDALFDQIVGGVPPTAEQLAEAPYLDEYVHLEVEICGRTHKVAVGNVTGHPRFGTSRGAQTAVIKLEGDGWILMLGRLYATGMCLDDKPVAGFGR